MTAKEKKKRKAAVEELVKNPILWSEQRSYRGYQWSLDFLTKTEFQAGKRPTKLITGH